MGCNVLISTIETLIISPSRTLLLRKVLKMLTGIVNSDFQPAPHTDKDDLLLGWPVPTHNFPFKVTRWLALQPISDHSCPPYRRYKIYNVARVLLSAGRQASPPSPRVNKTTWWPCFSPVHLGNTSTPAAACTHTRLPHHSWSQLRKKLNPSRFFCNPVPDFFFFNWDHIISFLDSDSYINYFKRLRYYFLFEQHEWVFTLGGKEAL